MVVIIISLRNGVPDCNRKKEEFRCERSQYGVFLRYIIPSELLVILIFDLKRMSMIKIFGQWGGDRNA